MGRNYKKIWIPVWYKNSAERASFEENMKLLFTNISDENQKEFIAQLKNVYRLHFQNAEPLEESIEDTGIHVVIIPNNLYFDDMEKAKTEMYEAKSRGDEPYMKDFVSDLQENLSFVPSIMPAIENEYDPCYSFTVEEMKQIKKWQREHRIKNHPEGETYQGAVGVERFEYTLLGTSIGMIKNCFCKECKDKYEEEAKEYTTGSLDELIGKVKPKYSRKERMAKLDELKNKWDYQIDFSDW